jgi:hypothetical protein
MVTRSPTRCKSVGRGGCCGRRILYSRRRHTIRKLGSECGSFSQSPLQAILVTRPGKMMRGERAGEQHGSRAATIHHSTCRIGAWAIRLQISQETCARPLDMSYGNSKTNAVTLNKPSRFRQNLHHAASPLVVTLSRFLLPRILPHGSPLRDAKINRRCKDRSRVPGALSVLTRSKLIYRAELARSGVLRRALLPRGRRGAI